MAEEHARHVWWNGTIFPEQESNSGCCPEGNLCLARNLSMASLNSVCVRNAGHYCTTKDWIFTFWGKKDIQLPEGTFTSAMALSFLYLLYSALLHMQSSEVCASIAAGAPVLTVSLCFKDIFCVKCCYIVMAKLPLPLILALVQLQSGSESAFTFLLFTATGYHDTEIKRVWGNMFFIKFLAIRVSWPNQE